MTMMARPSMRGARDDEAGEVRHLRLLARHHLRVVRLLSLRHARAVLRRAVLSARQRHRRPALGLRDLCRRLPHPAVRRARLRPHRRPRRPQIHLPHHHHGDGRRDLRGRPAADLQRDRLDRAVPAGGACACCRAWRSAASMAARRPMSPSMPARTSAASPRAWIQTTATLGFFLALLVIGLCRLYMDAGVVRRMGLAHPVPGLGHPARLLGLHPAAAERDRRSSRR